MTSNSFAKAPAWQNNYGAKLAYLKKTSAAKITKKAKDVNDVRNGR